MAEGRGEKEEAKEDDKEGENGEEGNGRRDKWKSLNK